METMTEYEIFDFQQEYETFETKLLQFEENFMAQINENWTKRVLVTQSNHNSRIGSGKEKCQEMNLILEKKQEESQKKCRVLEERNCKMQELKAVYREVNSEANDLIHKKEQMEKDLMLMMEKIHQEKDLISKQDNSVSKKMKEYEKAKNYFIERLGLHFKKTSSDRIQMVFKSINHRKPNKLYIFSIKIDENSKYLVTECHPLVPNIEELVQKLNATNNLSNFILSMRKAFKSLCH
ncbi:Hypothetical predicted protein [Octopus vulgaris]|uniref:Kinetochore protein SPC25 n=2 Tax=Octopus TaxID=6643 RepID=A0AA36BKS5_OCTVU|nr:Hypothetical predicted protein [Octopus vulgaris]